jgi:Flp pilus assembly protein TadD
MGKPQPDPPVRSARASAGRGYRRRVLRAATLIAAGSLAACALSGCATVDATRLFRSGTAALERGDSGVAVRDLEEAARLLPGSSAIHNHLGLAYVAARRDGDALREFERAVAIDCGNHAAQANLAVERRQLGK